MANIMFGRNIRFGRHRFATPIKRVGAVVIDYPLIDGHFAIDFYNSGGQRTATIASDAKNSPLVEAEFKLTTNGCAEVEFTLKPNHGIPIDYSQRIDIRLFGDSQPWYSGYILTQPVAGTTSETWEYSGYGFFQQLEYALVTRNFKNTEISRIAQTIITGDIESGTAARYNAGKIYNTGYTASSISFDYTTAKEALKQLSEFAANYIYGVDEYRDVYFKPTVTEINENSRFWVGYHVQEFIPEEDVSTVINYVYVQGGTLDSGGSNIMYQCRDDASIARYGKRAAVLSIPSAYADKDAKRWGDNELRKAKDPKRTATVGAIHPEVVKRNIRPEGTARITTFDGKHTYDYPISEVSYKLSKSGITMTMELGEYTKGLDQIILKMTRDAKNTEQLQRGNYAQLSS